MAAECLQAGTFDGDQVEKAILKGFLEDTGSIIWVNIHLRIEKQTGVSIVLQRMTKCKAFPLTAGKES